MDFPLQRVTTSIPAGETCRSVVGRRKVVLLISDPPSAELAIHRKGVKFYYSIDNALLKNTARSSSP